MQACATPDKPYLFAHEIGHLMTGNALHVPGDYQDDSKIDFYNALMWGDPGSADKKPHFYIDGHDGGRPNYTEFRFLPDRTFVKEQLVGGASNSPGRVSYNCVTRILAHSCAVPP